MSDAEELLRVYNDAREQVDAQAGYHGHSSGHRNALAAVAAHARKETLEEAKADLKGLHRSLKKQAEVFWKSGDREADHDELTMQALGVRKSIGRLEVLKEKRDG